MQISNLKFKFNGEESEPKFPSFPKPDDLLYQLHQQLAQQELTNSSAEIINLEKQIENRKDKIKLLKRQN